ncbi:MAG: hypothetical protein WBE34_10425 [Candidatus Nitrosopolaris sp.]
MNHKNMTLAIAAIVAAVAIPQQVLAYGHHHNNNNNNNNHNNGNSIKDDQQISQANFCTNQSFCDNEADNQADKHK